MPVTVRFPDGVEREVASALRSVATGNGSHLVEVPHECAEWRYFPLSGGKWMAVPKSTPGR